MQHPDIPFLESLVHLFPLRDPNASFSENDWNVLFRLFTFHQAHKGEVVIRVGETNRGIGFVLQGLMRFYYTKPNGDEFTSFFVRESEVIGSYESHILNLPSRQTIEAIEPTSYMFINYENLLELYRQVPLTEKIAHRNAEYYLARAQLRLATMLIDSPEERYLKLVEEESWLLQRVSQQLIASYLGITPVSLSRIRARLARRN
jgi:CRP/FNR family transcriptional regulator, anaerobic regulatory protein